MTKPLKRFFCACAVLLVCCLMLEGLAFQYDALHTRGLSPVALPEGAADAEEVQREENDITAVMPSTWEQGPLYRVTVTWEGLEFRDIRTLALRLEGGGTLTRVQVVFDDKL